MNPFKAVLRNMAAIFAAALFTLPAFAERPLDFYTRMITESAGGSEASAVKDMSMARHFAQLPVKVSAADLLTKVYGVVSPTLTKPLVRKEAGRLMNMVPVEDEMGLWLETADGYGVSYSGMTPDVSAMAQFEDDHVKDFAFFFLFPYSRNGRSDANDRQADFCGSLLQEMNDIGADMDVNTLSDALFEISGRYADNFVEMRLVEDTVADAAGKDNGRFIVIITVEPDGYRDGDIPALAPAAGSLAAR